MSGKLSRKFTVGAHRPTGQRASDVEGVSTSRTPTALYLFRRSQKKRVNVGSAMKEVSQHHDWAKQVRSGMKAKPNIHKGEQGVS